MLYLSSAIMSLNQLIAVYCMCIRNGYGELDSSTRMQYKNPQKCFENCIVATIVLEHKFSDSMSMTILMHCIALICLGRF
jgi:hypothetical protein